MWLLQMAMTGGPTIFVLGTGRGCHDKVVTGVTWIVCKTIRDIQTQTNPHVPCCFEGKDAAMLFIFLVSSAFPQTDCRRLQAVNHGRSCEQYCRIVQDFFNVKCVPQSKIRVFRENFFKHGVFRESVRVFYLLEPIILIRHDCTIPTVTTCHLSHSFYLTRFSL